MLARRLSRGVARIQPWNDRHKFYNDELALTLLEEASLELVYWLEDQGYPSIIVPPTHVDPWSYDGDPQKPPDDIVVVAACRGRSRPRHARAQSPTADARIRAARRAHRGSVFARRRMRQQDAAGALPRARMRALPQGLPGRRGRTLEPRLAGLRQVPLAAWLPAIDRSHCADHRRTGHRKQKDLLRSEDSFNLWQSTLRGAGAITGCRRCADICPVGADYEAMLRDVGETIPENTPAKEARAAQMAEAEHDRAAGWTVIARRRAGSASARRLRQRRNDRPCCPCPHRAPTLRPSSQPQGARRRTGAARAVLCRQARPHRSAQARRRCRMAKDSGPDQGYAARPAGPGILRLRFASRRRMASPSTGAPAAPPARRCFIRAASKTLPMP